MGAIRDKTFLLNFAKAVQAELQRRHIKRPFQLKHKLTTQKLNESDGWTVQFGSFIGYQCHAEIWLDRFTAYADRKIYYCLYSKKKEGLAKLASAVYSDFGKHLSIYYKDWNDDSKDNQSVRLAKKLAKYRFGQPLYERYPKGKIFIYGIYEYDSTGLQKNQFNRLVERSVDFFYTITEAVTDTPPRDPGIYETVENRQAVRRHIYRERKSYAATLAKQRDNYICQVCGFDFSKVYGTLGCRFAEAHHNVPLGKNKNLRTTRIDDLTTVCANCHRMLGRMKGKQSDIEELKKIIKYNRRN